MKKEQPVPRFGLRDTESNAIIFNKSPDHSHKINELKLIIGLLLEKSDEPELKERLNKI